MHNDGVSWCWVAPQPGGGDHSPAQPRLPRHSERAVQQVQPAVSQLPGGGGGAGAGQVSEPSSNLPSKRLCMLAEFFLDIHSFKANSLSHIFIIFLRALTKECLSLISVIIGWRLCLQKYSLKRR